ncbi:MAG: hypothetical protein JWL71_5108, partial [Acidobacteria bacterium]|nr:hypothetical protein [Acidobacteriota bacterium]
MLLLTAALAQVASADLTGVVRDQAAGLAIR